MSSVSYLWRSVSICDHSHSEELPAAKGLFIQPRPLCLNFRKECVCVNVKVEECSRVVLNFHLALRLMNIIIWDENSSHLLSIWSWPARVRSPQIPAAHTEGHNPDDKINVARFSLLSSLMCVCVISELWGGANRNPQTYFALFNPCGTF